MSSVSVSQLICVRASSTAFEAWESIMPSSDSDVAPPSEMSVGRGDDDKTLAGNEEGTCIVIEYDFAGAKSSSVKIVELKG